MKRFEYLTSSHNESCTSRPLEIVLNELGQQGWELVSSNRLSDKTYNILKREVMSHDPRA